MSDTVVARDLENVPCPFCGLLCDDLRVSTEAEAVTVRANGCAKSRGLFAAGAHPVATPALDGKPVTLEHALARATALLRAAQRPLLLSAGTDVAGIRALIELAELTGGIVDHVNREAVSRTLRVLQDTGWISTTLTEVRNRADLLVVAGGEIGSRFPRFFERCFGTFDTLFEPDPRELIFLGAIPEDLPDAMKKKSASLPIEPRRLGEVFAVLRALLGGRRVETPDVAGISTEKLAALVARMRAATYGVLAWTAAEFDFPHADLTVQAMCELVRDLNGHTRFAVLPLAGSEGDMTALQVTTWQTGFPLSVDFGAGAPAQVPLRYALDELIEREAIDALVFVSAFDAARTPPAANIPVVVLGRAGMRCDCSVFIPVSVCGLHHTGHLYRTDSVVAMRMRQVAESDHPSAADVLQQLLAAMRAAR